MSAVTGTGTLIRLVLRRDRVRTAVWVVALGAFTVVSAVSVQDLYPSQADLAQYAETVQTNQAVIALSGPARSLDTYGGRIAFEVWPFSVAIGLMAAFAVGRHTRAEEESGRAEMVGAGPVGRHARSLAAVAVSVASSAMAGGAVGLGLVLTGLPAGGAVTMAAAFAATGTVFAGVSLLAAQVTEHTRAGTGLAAASVGLAFVLRAVGDGGSGSLSWLSPLGWAQATRPFSGDRWWPLGLSVATTAVLLAVAFAVEARRDVGAGLVRARPGPPRASRILTHPVGLAWRLQRSGLVGWAVGVGLGGAAMGSVADSADDLVGDNESIRDYLAQLGDAALAEVFLATLLIYLALVTSGFAVGAVLRARGEEAAGRAEPVLATAVTRRAWLGGHLSVALLGTVVLLVVGGTGMGLAYGLSVGELGQVPRMGAAALAYVPAVALMAGVAAVLGGVVPRLASGAWVVLAAAVVISVLGEAIGLPAAARGLSPFTHVPGVPAVGVESMPLALLALLAVATLAAGVVGFDRRDVG